MNLIFSQSISYSFQSCIFFLQNLRCPTGTCGHKTLRKLSSTSLLLEIYQYLLLDMPVITAFPHVFCNLLVHVRKICNITADHCSLQATWVYLDVSSFDMVIIKLDDSWFVLQPHVAILTIPNFHLLFVTPCCRCQGNWCNCYHFDYCILLETSPLHNDI